MKVLFVIPSLERGGSEGQLLRLLRQVHGESMAATVATLSREADPEHAAALRAIGVPHVVLTPGRQTGAHRGRVAAWALHRLLRTLGPDVVYAWGEPATGIGVPLARLHRIPVVVARRRVGDRRAGPTVGVIRRLEAAADVVTGNSAAVLAGALAHGVPETKLRLILNGHEARAPLPAPPAGTPVVLGYVAGFRPEKGHLRLLEALGKVEARTPWRVDLAGDGPLRARVTQAVAEAGLGDRVRSLGMVSVDESFWRSRHAAVLLSDSEGGPNALIEAGMAGRPLIAAAVPGCVELLAGGAGLLVARDDTDAIARGLERLIDEPELRERLGRRARERMAAFDPDTMGAGHVAALREAIASRSGRAARART